MIYIEIPYDIYNMRPALNCK